MIKYELTFIVEENGTADAVLKLLEENSIKSLKTTDCGAREFAYPIKKQQRGRYFDVLFEAQPEMLAKLEKPLRLEPAVLRYLIVKALRVPAPLAPVKKRIPKAEEKEVEKPAQKLPEETPVETREEARTKKIEEPAEKPKAPAKKPEMKKPVRKVIKPAGPVEQMKEAKKEEPKGEEIAKDLLDEKLKDLVED